MTDKNGFTKNKNTFKIRKDYLKKVILVLCKKNVHAHLQFKDGTT